MQERWVRLRRSLWQPPRPHGEQPRERVVGPLELFYDLAVVVLVAQAAHRLAGHLSWAGLGQFVVVFTLVWIAWANGSLHHELHGHDDARARSTFLLQILVLAAMGASIPQAGGARGAAFAVAAAVLFAVLAVLWLLAARGDRPEYRRPSRLFVAGTAACAVLLAGTALLPADARVSAWGALDVAYLAGFATVLLITDPADAPGITITEALTERFGAFIIIVLGETLTGVVTGLSSRPLARTCTASAAACLCLAAARPAPLLLALGLVLLLSIPWVYAVARRLAGAAGGSDPDSGPSGVKVSDAAPSLRRSATAGRPADLRGLNSCRNSHQY